MSRRWQLGSRPAGDRHFFFSASNGHYDFGAARDLSAAEWPQASPRIAGPCAFRPAGAIWRAERVVSVRMGLLHSLSGSKNLGVTRLHPPATNLLHAANENTRVLPIFREKWRGYRP